MSWGGLLRDQVGVRGQEVETSSIDIVLKKGEDWVEATRAEGVLRWFR